MFCRKATHEKSEIKHALSGTFKVRGPTRVALDLTSGEQIAGVDLRGAVSRYGGDAFPLSTDALTLAEAAAL